MRVFFMRHITGDSREQATMLPSTLDDYVATDHPVRVIDAFVDSLDMKSLGFSKAETCETGRKPYHPQRNRFCLILNRYAFFRLAIPARPRSPDPNNHTDAGTGTGEEPANLALVIPSI